MAFVAMMLAFAVVFSKLMDVFNGGKHMLITKDMFYIAYPHDGHKAVSHVDGKNTFTKIILKLPV